jgi:hypothetical protein
MSSPIPVDDWGLSPFRAATESKDTERVIETLAPDIVFRSPTVFSPYSGREAVATLLRAIDMVLGPNLVYQWQVQEGDREVLCFTSRVGKREIEGVQHPALRRRRPGGRARRDDAAAERAAHGQRRHGRTARSGSVLGRWLDLMQARRRREPEHAGDRADSEQLIVRRLAGERDRPPSSAPLSASATALAGGPGGIEPSLRPALIKRTRRLTSPAWVRSSSRAIGCRTPAGRGARMKLAAAPPRRCPSDVPIALARGAG